MKTYSMNVVPDSQSLRGGLLLLAPPRARVADSFSCVRNDPREHQRLLTGLQKLRGELYLADGAIQTWQLSPGGRHRQAADEHRCCRRLISRPGSHTV